MANRPRSVGPGVLPLSMIHIPRDHSAMDVDVHAAGTRFTKSPTPLVVSFAFYQELCHQLNLCWGCLMPYDKVHRSQKLTPTQPQCPNLPVDSPQMDQFTLKRQT